MLKTRAIEIATKALQTRKQYLNIGAHVPICPYVLSDVMGFDLRFFSIPSFEGMYVAEENLILISSDRPEGRKRFTCAHEIGHHVLRHGTVIDEIVENGSDKELEKEADLFAGIVLAPKIAVQHAIKGQGKTITNLTRQDVYILSKYFGVSYSAFLTHLRYSLQLIGDRQLKTLEAKSLSMIRNSLCPIETKNQVFIIGNWWQGKAIDVESGDIIIFDSKPYIDGPTTLAVHEHSGRYVCIAEYPGITRVYNEYGWSSFIKISKRKYQGMFQFKYEEDVE